MERVAPAWSLGVLAGGRSERMGRDKATLVLGKRTILEHVARRLAPPGVPTWVATAPGGPGSASGIPVAPDPIPGAGPLAGLAALLEAVETPYVLATACDQPLLPPDLGDRLLAHARGVDAVLISVGERLQPFPCLLSSELFPTVRALLDDGRRRALAYWDHAPCARVPFEELYPGVDPAEALAGANDPAAFTGLLHRLRIPAPR